MLRILFLFMVFGIPVNLKAASVYDKNLMAFDKKKNEKIDEIKTDELHLLHNIDERKTEYEAELISILKKKTVSFKLVANSLAESNSSNFVQFGLNGKVDERALLEAETDWLEIKAGLKDVNAILNSFNRKAINFLDEYLEQNINTDFILIANVQTVRHSNQNLKYEKNISNVSYKYDAHAKADNFTYKTLSYGDELNGLNGSDFQTKSDDKNIFSIIYLWKMYSDTIVIVVSSVATLWLVIASLIKFLTWNGRRVD